jgi:molybdopterin molybdotransferase
MSAETDRAVPSLVDVDDAYTILFAHTKPIGARSMPLAEARFRTLAEAVRCDVDYPPFDRSVMDGYAVRAEDVRGAPVALEVVGELAAGTVSNRALRTGEAMQINTGAPLPDGADAVVRVEDTEADGAGGRVVIRKAVERGTFITRRAEYVRAGDVVLAAGSVLGPAQVGAAAAAGASRVTVYRQPQVAILSTGDELVEIDRRPEGGQIRNSNQHLLAALVRSAHAEAALLGTVGDDRVALRERIERGLSADVLCITGGASVGPLDLVPDVLRECGVTFHFQKMKIKPGRPIHFATGPSGGLVFALPGNPVSAFVGFELLVGPALAAVEGRPNNRPGLLRATLRGNIAATRDRRTYVPARGCVDGGGLLAEPVLWRGSGDPFGLAGANAMIMRPPGAAAVASGGEVSILLLGRI